jgi:branched-chain amino acid transport system permease protein
MLNYFSSYLVVACIYAIMALGLNLQWGFTGLMNFGIGAFYMLGAYTSAILTGSPSPDHLGGFALPVILGILGAALLPGFIAWLLSFPALKLRGGPFAIALLAIMETLHLVIRNESWLTNGVWGIRGIPRPFFEIVNPRIYSFYFLIIAATALTLTWLAMQRVVNSPWGRVLRGIREDEYLTSMSGKNIFRYRQQSFVLSSMIMGVAGSLYVHYTGFVSPQVFSPLVSTFIVWLMVMVGGTGSNSGVVLGAFLVWAVWVGSDFLTDLVPASIATQIGFIRMLAVGAILMVTILTRPQGLLSRRLFTVEILGKRERRK